MIVHPTRADRQRARAIRQRLRREHRRPLFRKVRALLEDGRTPEEIATALAPTIDALIPLGALGPWGAAAELVDGPILWLVVVLVAREVQRTLAAQ